MMTAAVKIARDLGTDSRGCAGDQGGSVWARDGQ
jgi:hypothetical protein